MLTDYGLHFTLEGVPLMDLATHALKKSLSLYKLDINDSTVIPDVLRFRGREALSQPFSWRIEFTTPQTIQGEDVLMKYASFDMNGHKAIHGIITAFEWLSTSADQSHYAITLESRLTLLSHSRRCAVFQNQSVPEVVEQVLRAQGLEGADFEFRLSLEYPCREVITQWRETDLEFIQRLLAEVGIWFHFEMNSATELDVVIFGDTQLQYVFDVRLPYREPSGLSAEECVWGVRTWHNVVPGGVHANTYNYRILAALPPKHSISSMKALKPGRRIRPVMITSQSAKQLLPLIIFVNPHHLSAGIKPTVNGYVWYTPAVKDGWMFHPGR